jgi:hypothetical protein
MKRTPLKRYVGLRRGPWRRRVKKSKLQKRIDNPNSSYWRSKADLAWGKMIHAAFGEKCAVNNSECKGKVEAHHLCGRNPVVRHNPDLGILLCTIHHKFSQTCSPHGGPAGFFVWLSSNFAFKQTLCAQYYRGELKRVFTSYQDAAEKLSILNETEMKNA